MVRYLTVDGLQLVEQKPLVHDAAPTLGVEPNVTIQAQWTQSLPDQIGKNRAIFVDKALIQSSGANRIPPTFGANSSNSGTGLRVVEIRRINQALATGGVTVSEIIRQVTARMSIVKANDGSGSNLGQMWVPVGLWIEKVDGLEIDFILSGWDGAFQKAYLLTYARGG